MARQFRRAPTDSERAAWQVLRNRRCLGLKFRRQQPIRGYIVDFYCARLRLAVEIDGPVHWSSADRFMQDLERNERLEEHGVAVLRIRPQDVPHLAEIIAWFLRENPLSREGEGKKG
jgi:very-short-patch-repair endonuclease